MTLARIAAASPLRVSPPECPSFPCPVPPCPVLAVLPLPPPSCPPARPPENMRSGGPMDSVGGRPFLVALGLGGLDPVALVPRLDVVLLLGVLRRPVSGDRIDLIDVGVFLRAGL